MQTKKNKLDVRILPSLLAADLGHLAEACRAAAVAGADGLHLDIMDGHFVPNLSMGPDVVRMARAVAPDLYRHVHLMVTHPHELADAFIAAGAQTLFFHVEARVEPTEMIAHIRKAGIKVGMVANPETPVDALIPYLESIDEVLLMSVHPGFGGQAFMPEVLPKIRVLRDRVPELPISIDGGITLETAPRCAREGANVMIAGTALFRSAHIAADIKRMRDECQSSLMLRSHVSCSES